MFFCYGFLSQAHFWLFNYQDAGVYILQPIVLENCMVFSPDFSLQAVMYFLQALVLNTFAVGSRLFPYVGKICIFVAILTLFHSVFCYGFPFWVQFWLFIYQSAWVFTSQPIVL